MSFALFILSFASISFLPGLCMSLALSLGLSIGFKKTLWMMAGELLGVLVVILICAFSAKLILSYEFAFKVLQIGGVFFLFDTSFVLFRQKISLTNAKLSTKDRISLILQGFLATISNPKAWIFMLALLPALLDEFSLALICVVILFIEFCALCVYASGGSAFSIFLARHIDKLSKLSAFCVFLMACFMLYEALMSN